MIKQPVIKCGPTGICDHRFSGNTISATPVEHHMNQEERRQRTDAHRKVINRKQRAYRVKRKEKKLEGFLGWPLV